MPSEDDVADRRRRRLLQGLTAGIALPSGLARAADAAAPVPAFASAASAGSGAAGRGPATVAGLPSLRDFLRMRGAIDDRVVIGFMSGMHHGVVDDELQPLYGLLSATFSRWRPLADGSWFMASMEQAYFTDLASGAVLGEWKNPYNGETVAVPVVGSPPSQRILGSDLVFKPTRPLPADVSLEHRVIAGDSRADERVVIERARFVSRPAPPARPFRYAEIVTMRSPAAAFADREAARVPCSTAYASVSSWRPWQKMADRPGHLLATGWGRYGATFETVPPVWLEATRRLRPELIEDPARLLEPAWRA